MYLSTPIARGLCVFEEIMRKAEDEERAMELGMQVNAFVEIFRYFLENI